MAVYPPSEPWLCRTMLQVAAYGGHTSVVESQIAAGVAIDETDERGKTALMFASWNGHLRAVQLLLQAGADVNRMNRIDSSTSLLYAVERGHTAVVDALLKAGARTDLRNQDGEFPLTIACAMAFADIVEKLIAAGADVNQPAQNQGLVDVTVAFTPLMYACRKGCLTSMEMLLKAGASVEAVDDYGYTALMHACHDGYVDTVSVLLAAGADIRHISAAFGNTALHEAPFAFKYDVDAATLIDIIIAEGADIDAVDIRGQTTLASSVRGTALVCKLLALGADVNLGDQSPLMSASRRCDGETVSVLLAAGADVNHRDDRGETPIQVAAANGHTDIVRLLLDAYADKDAVGANGQETLMRAERQSRNAVVKFIRNCGCVIG